MNEPKYYTMESNEALALLHKRRDATVTRLMWSDTKLRKHFRTLDMEFDGCWRDKLEKVCYHFNDRLNGLELMAGCTEEREDGQTAQAWRIHLICREQAAFANWDVLVWSEIKPTLAGAWDSFRESEMQKMMDRGVQVEQEKISMGTTPVGEVD